MLLQMLPGFAMATSQQDVTFGREEPLRKGPISNPNKNKKNSQGLTSSLGMLQPFHSPVLWFPISNSQPPLELGMALWGGSIFRKLN